MRIIQLPPVISTRGNRPPSSKPNGTSSSPNDVSSSSSSNNNKHFLIIPPRRYSDNNNSRKANGQNGSIPTCERLDRRGIRTFVSTCARSWNGSDTGVLKAQKRNDVIWREVQGQWSWQGEFDTRGRLWGGRRGRKDQCEDEPWSREEHDRALFVGVTEWPWFFKVKVKITRVGEEKRRHSRLLMVKSVSTFSKKQKKKCKLKVVKSDKIEKVKVMLRKI